MSTTSAPDVRSSSHGTSAVAAPAGHRAQWPTRLRDPGFQAYLVLRVAFVAAPFLFGIDKFFNWMTYWPKYLWIGIPHLFSVSPQDFMYFVGGVEIAAAILGIIRPRIAPYVVSAWLAGIVGNLVIKSIAVGGHTHVYWDIAVRDFGLFIGALALARLTSVYAPERFFGSSSR